MASDRPLTNPAPSGSCPNNSCPNNIRIRGVLVFDDGTEHEVDVLLPVTSWMWTARRGDRVMTGECLGDGDPARFTLRETADG